MTPSIPTNYRMDSEVKAIAQAQGEARGMSESAFVQHAIREYVRWEVPGYLVDRLEGICSQIDLTEREVLERACGLLLAGMDQGKPWAEAALIVDPSARTGLAWYTTLVAQMASDNRMLIRDQATQYLTQLKRGVTDVETFKAMAEGNPAVRACRKAGMPLPWLDYEPEYSPHDM